MPDFVINIRTLADLAGAQATAATLVSLTQQAGALSASATAAAGQEGAAAAAAVRLGQAAAQAGQAHFNPLGQSARDAGGHISAASHEADHLFSALKAGVALDLGHKLVEGVAEIPALFQEAIAEGVRYNAEVEKLGVTLGSALRAADPGKYLNFEAARAAGGQVLDSLRTKANALGLDFVALTESLSINLATLEHGGINDIQKQIDTVVLLQQVTAAKGITGFQATRDIIDLLNGLGERTIFGKELAPLGITNETIKQAKETGTLYELLTSKLGSYSEAASASSETFAASEQRLKNVTEQLYGEISKPVFDEIKAAYASFVEEITKPEVSKELKTLGYDVAALVATGASLARFAIENAGFLARLGEGVVLLATVLAAYKLAQIASIIPEKLIALAAETEATAAHAAAVGADTTAIEANTVARGTNATSGAGGTGGIGGTIGKVAAGAIALVGGFEAGQYLQNRRNTQEGETDAETGTQSSNDTARLLQLQQEIKEAATLEEHLEKRKELVDLLDNAHKRLSETLNEQSKTLDSYEKHALGERAENLLNLIGSIDLVRKKVESTDPDDAVREAAERRANAASEKSQDALNAYHDTPEYQVIHAKRGGDPETIEAAEHSAAVDKTAKELRHEFHGLKPEDAEREAEEAVGVKDDEKAAKEQKKKDDEARRNDEAANKAAKRLEETAAEEESTVAILRAKVSGNADLTKKLEDQLALQKEMRRLIAAGFADDLTTEALAREKVGLERQVTTEKEAQAKAKSDEAEAEKNRKQYEQQNPNARRVGEGGSAYFARTGRIDASNVHDSDPGGGLHSGGLNVGPVATGGLGPGGSASQSSASLALNKLPGLFGAGSTFNPFPRLDLAPTATANVTGFLANTAVGRAASANLDGAVPLAPGANNGAGSGMSNLATSAKSAGTSLDANGQKLASEAEKASAALRELTGKFASLGPLAGKITSLASDVQTLQSQVNLLMQ